MIANAGVANVLAPLWPVEDRVARQFLIAYSRHLPETGPAGALRETCRGFLKDGARLRHWAAFTLVGAGRSWDA